MKKTSISAHDNQEGKEEDVDEPEQSLEIQATTIQTIKSPTKKSSQTAVIISP